MTAKQQVLDRMADLIIECVRHRKTLARVRALLDGRLVIWPEDLKAALEGENGGQIDHGC